MSATGPFGAFANEYHGRGLNAIPVLPGTKQPAVPWRGWQRRRQSADEVRRLIETHPGADIGIVLGGFGGLVDFDVDSLVGEEALVSLARGKKLPLPATTMFESPRGHHRLFRAVGPIPSRLRLVEDVDLLAEGRFLVAPPSTGRAWLTGLDALAPLPVAWEAFLQAAQTPSEWAASRRAAEHFGVPEGERNITLARLVGSKLTAGVSDVEIVRWAREWAKRCAPGSHPFTSEEAERVALSIIETRRRTRSPAEAALFVGRERGLDAVDRLVLVALATHQRDLGGPVTFAAPCRLIGSLAGFDPGTVARVYRRLREAGLIFLSAIRDPDGRRVSAVRFRPPLPTAT